LTSKLSLTKYNRP